MSTEIVLRTIADDIRADVSKYYEEQLKRQAEYLRISRVEYLRDDGSVEVMRVIRVNQTPNGVVVQVE